MTEDERMEMTKKELEKRKIRDFQLKGRPGKGHKGNYKWYCSRCCVEYWIDDIEKCTHCGNENMVTEEVSVKFVEILESSFFNTKLNSDI